MKMKTADPQQIWLKIFSVTLNTFPSEYCANAASAILRLAPGRKRRI